MKKVVALTSLLSLSLVLAVPSLSAQSATVSTYGGTTLVSGPYGPPIWQLTSLSSGSPAYSGVIFQINGTLTANDLTTLSADFQMLEGTTDGGAPRFSLADSSGNEAYLYFGVPNSSGGFTDPHPGTYESTGNFALSTDAVVQSNNFGGYNSGYPAITWADFLSQVGSVDISTIYVDLDGGFTGSQIADVANVDINGTIYNPSATPEPSSLLLLGTTLFAAAGMIWRRRTSFSF